MADDSLRDQTLIDPAWCPAMHAQLVAALEELHALEREDGPNAQYVTFRRRNRTTPTTRSSTSGTALLKWPGGPPDFCVPQQRRPAWQPSLKRTGPWGCLRCLRR